MQPRRNDGTPQAYFYDYSTRLHPGGYYLGDCFELLQEVESGSAGMVLIDPPYYIKKDQWDDFEGKADYLDFMGRAFIQVQRILRPNGTLGFWHGDLRKIAWLHNWLETYTDMRLGTWGILAKPNHRKKLWACPGPDNSLRSWFNICEFCLFYIKTEPGTAWNRTGLAVARLDTEKFGTLREYFRRMQQATGDSRAKIIEKCGQAADHCFRWNSSQWDLPTRETYLKIVAAYRLDTWPEYRTFDSLDAERAALTAEYEEQIRAVDAARFVHNLDNGHCNIWLSKEPLGRKKAHPCQKPVDVLERIIATHTKPGDLVVDFFAGSGATGVAAIHTSRQFLLIDQSAEYQQAGAEWIENEKAALCI